MASVTTDFKGPDFSICWGRIDPNSRFDIIYRNLTNPEFLNGNITQWLYLIDGAAHIVVDQQEIPFETGVLKRLPILNGKKITWVSSDVGAVWISFNPNPHTDNYDCEKIDIPQSYTHNLEPKEYDRHLILLNGLAVVENQLGIKKTLDRKTTIKVKSGSRLTISSTIPTSVGVFWKNELL
jgi:hypothetical protein